MITFSYQGIPGAYSEQACEELAKKLKLTITKKPQKSFNQCFESLNESTLTLLPFENSTAGSIVENYDLLLEHDVEIIGEYYLQINHCLLTNKGAKLKEIKKVYSHPQALAQCSKFLNQKHLTPNPYFDTAGAAREIAKLKDNTKAAISSKLAAKTYNLKILMENFQNQKNNTTRFLLLKRKQDSFDFEQYLTKTKTTLQFETKDIPSALFKVLEVFHKKNLNLTKIESRPSKKEKFSYIFTLDIQESLDKKDPVFKKLEKLTEFYTNLGSY